ncbi:MAG: DUF3524 domain-containing protein [Bacteroidetes bacterium]|nr:DUF3524 domain-containing protein [Bacteroidota bacterium]
MRILLIEPFFTGSHQQWAEGLKAFSGHQIDLLTLPGRHWKWRMFGGAVSLAEKAILSEHKYDLFLVSDMLDLCTFLALWQKSGKMVPRIAMYFHENQITYPWSPDDQIVERNEQYGFINYTSALAADVLFFNSDFHRMDFLKSLPAFLRKYPDYKGLKNIPKIEAKAKTLHLGMDLRKLDVEEKPQRNGSPVLLWNCRWEYDKDPETFFRLCFRLVEADVDFRLIVLGETYSKQPAIFESARARLRERILHWGYAPSRKEYAQLLWHADILPLTSRQDFFGGSTVEAIYCGAYPILPNRLAFPEHLPTGSKENHLYEAEDQLFEKTLDACENIDHIRKTDVKADLRKAVKKYDWREIIKHYDRVFSESLPLRK